MPNARKFHHTITAGSLLAVMVLIAAPAAGADCQKLLEKVVGNQQAFFSYFGVSMVTMNNSGIVSYAGSTLHYVPASIKNRIVVRPARFVTLTNPGEFGPDLPKTDFGKGVQVFSDRCPGAGCGGQHWSPLRSPGLNISQAGPQPFDINQADDLAIEILDTSTADVTITLRSWNNGSVHFTPSCEDDFMFGKTPDVKYILHFQSL